MTKEEMIREVRQIENAIQYVNNECAKLIKATNSDEAVVETLLDLREGYINGTRAINQIEGYFK